MSRSPTSPSPDIRRLVEEGYDVEVAGGLLRVADIPFLDGRRTVRRGRLVVPLSFEGERVGRPLRHAVWWCGGPPCDVDGRPLDHVGQEADVRRLDGGLQVDHLLCVKPQGREFHDYHELVTTYVLLLSTPVISLRPETTARRSGRRGSLSFDAAPFRYVDTATTRSGVGALADGLRDTTVGIVGLGGTGSYVLDLVAKTPVRTIHLFDGDTFEQHNAFRAPGAATTQEVISGRTKVTHWRDVYSRMHGCIVAHPLRIDSRTAPLLDVCDFVFVCVDAAEAKPAIVERLAARAIPFVDVGMGLSLTHQGLRGAVRTTYSNAHGHARALEAIPVMGLGDPLYASNIQLADLNCLNAALAVICWKRHFGFYPSSGASTTEVFVVDDGHLHRDEST